MPSARSRPSGCFWLPFLLLGLVLTAFFGNGMIVPAVRANLFYEETTCSVLGKRWPTVFRSTSAARSKSV